MNQFSNLLEAVNLEPWVYELLAGRSEVVETHRPGSDEKVVVSVVRHGSCLLGLTDWRESLQWSEVNADIWRLAGYATLIATVGVAVGEKIDVSRVASSILAAHAMTRVSKEADWYPDVVVNAEAKKRMGNKGLTLYYLNEESVQKLIIAHTSVVANVKAHLLLSESLNSWEEVICSLVAKPINQESILEMAERWPPLDRVLSSTDAKSRFNDFVSAIHNQSVPWEDRLRVAYIDTASVTAFSAITKALMDFVHRQNAAGFHQKSENSGWWHNGMHGRYQELNGIPLPMQQAYQAWLGSLRKTY